MTVSEVAERLNLAHPAGGRLPPLLLMTDETRLADPQAVLGHLTAGTGVIFRHYDAPDRKQLATELAAACRKHGVPLLVGADASLAEAVGAAGLHLQEEALLRDGIEHRRPDWLVTAAAHSAEAVERAAELGLDAVLLSPVFRTASHPDVEPMGPDRFREIVERVEIPVYALGGISDANADQLLGSGAVGIAGISGIAGD